VPLWTPNTNRNRKQINIGQTETMMRMHCKATEMKREENGIGYTEIICSGLVSSMTAQKSE